VAEGEEPADVTVCYGPRDCTVVTGGGSRKLSLEEVEARGREKARDKISDIDCDFADDPEACRSLKAQLLSRFKRAP
jgi:hypothetical protein